MPPTKKQLKQKVRELEAQLGAGQPAPLEPQDIVDWLYDQYEAPHPLRTSNETMMMWLQAMNTGLSKNNLNRRLSRVMELWRQQAMPGETYTRQQQQELIAREGAYLMPVVLTTTWQQHLQAKKAKQEQEKDDESMDEQMQSGTELEYSSIMSIDLPPVDPIVSAANFAFAFVSAGTPPRAGFGLSDVVSTLNLPPPVLDTSTASASAAPAAYTPRARTNVPVRRSRGPWHQYAADPVPNLFPGYPRLGPVILSGSQQRSQDELSVLQSEENKLVDRLEQQDSPHGWILPPRLRMPAVPSRDFPRSLPTRFRSRAEQGLNQVEAAASSTLSKKRSMNAPPAATISAQPHRSSRRRVEQDEASREVGHETDESHKGPVRGLPALDYGSDRD
ncbi:hypothetical protein M436DRAFT_82078 [Aureobasidium namibiae CBS 147.97]|uniref:Uncharacterized protein n=1 Tax=Aureobasidium namibiae CBS 147.97 TaxID=1043004 RepID=A0A074WMH4_9PEZI|nr:uncharacterized protein M436DRAFT_82078 [Aureobasidium namibiae CBS 147.97]KEQ72799.1 hypothetical protein M436DRAFT_82078 [Aureobasidium namibiae CBS 147.97]